MPYVDLRIRDQLEGIEGDEVSVRVHLDELVDANVVDLELLNLLLRQAFVAHLHNSAHFLESPEELLLFCLVHFLISNHLLWYLQFEVHELDGSVAGIAEKVFGVLGTVVIQPAQAQNAHRLGVLVDSE